MTKSNKDENEKAIIIDTLKTFSDTKKVDVKFLLYYTRIDKLDFKYLVQSLIREGLVEYFNDIDYSTSPSRKRMYLSLTKKALEKYPD